MQTEAALSAIMNNLQLFGADQLTRLEPAKVKTLRLLGKLAYFQGGTTYHRVAVVCPLGNALSHLQQLIAGLVWANKVSNGQKTILYLVGEGFSPVLMHLVKLFGPRVEVRLAYFTPKLTIPFMIAGKDARSATPGYANPVSLELWQWERKFNPVEKGWFQAAIEYFKGFGDKQVEICCLDNWVSVKFRGLEVARICKKENRLMIFVITRYPRETTAGIGNREEKEGWFNSEGRLNSEFIKTFEERIDRLGRDEELFARVCSDKQRLEYLVLSSPKSLALEDRMYYQLDVGKKGQTNLIVELLGKKIEGNLITAVVHPQKDLLGFGQCLEQLVWAKLKFDTIYKMYFPTGYLCEPEGWLICPQGKLHAELEMLKSLLHPEERVNIVVLNDDWSEKGIIPIRIC